MLTFPSVPYRRWLTRSEAASSWLFTEQSAGWQSCWPTKPIHQYRLPSTAWISPAIWSVTTGSQRSGPMKSFWRPTSLVRYRWFPPQQLIGSHDWVRKPIGAWRDLSVTQRMIHRWGTGIWIGRGSITSLNSQKNLSLYQSLSLTAQSTHGSATYLPLSHRSIHQLQTHQLVTDQWPDQ